MLDTALLLSVIGLLLRRFKIDDPSFLSRGTEMASQVQPQEATGGHDQDRRRVVRNVAARGKDHAAIQACVAVALAFGAQAVAECVEHTRTVDCLHVLGVDWCRAI